MPLRRAVRGTLNYVGRVAIWRRILRSINGDNPRDRLALRRSALRAPITAWGDFYSWRDPVLLEDVDVTVPALGRFRAHARSDELFLMLPEREAAVYAAARTLLRPGDTVVDAGANIGVFSVFAARCIGSAGRLIAVEMIPRTAARLRANIARNGLTAEVVETAIGARSGEIVVAAMDAAKGGQATLALSHTLAAPERIEVQTRTLDELLADMGEIALMKMDIEGAELAALEGARAVLPRIRAIIFEQLDDSGVLAQTIAALGYRIEQLDRHNYLARRIG